MDGAVLECATANRPNKTQPPAHGSTPFHNLSLTTTIIKQQDPRDIHTMRILVSSAGLATFVSSSASAGGRDESPPVFDAAKSSIAKDVDESYNQRSNVRLGEECDPTPTSVSNTEDNRLAGPMDVGVLLCEGDLSCAPDSTSSTGGRCTKSLTTAAVKGRPTQAIFRKNRRAQHLMTSQPRNLQIDTPNLGGNSTEEEFVCPVNCPQDFCDCAEKFKEAKFCAEELDSICRNDQLRFCTPEKYKPFYDAAYCPFAECLSVNKNPFEDCSCQYYRNYCTLYYDFQESFDACEAADCCQELPTEEKHVCLAELAPTTSPTGSPTMTQAPSVSPTVRPNDSHSYLTCNTLRDSSPHLTKGHTKPDNIDETDHFGSPYWGAHNVCRADDLFS